ncbi:MAG: tetratricopeptide repeat protein, partial [Litorivicinus sp.]
GAVSSLDEALSLAPEELAPLVALGVALQGIADFDRSIEVFDQVIERSPGLEQAHSGRAYSLQLRGDHEVAIEAYHQALDVHFERIATRIIEQQGISQEDPELFRYIMFNELKREPFTAIVYNNIGLCYLNAGEREGAKAYFSDAIRHIPVGYGYPDPAENLDLLTPLPDPVADDTRTRFHDQFDVDLPVFGGTGARRDPVVLIYEAQGSDIDLVTIEHQFVRCVGRGIDFEVISFVSSELLTLGKRVLDKVRFEIEEVQGVEKKRIVRTFWFDVTAVWHRDAELNPH